MPNTTTNHAISYTNTAREYLFTDYGLLQQL